MFMNLPETKKSKRDNFKRVLSDRVQTNTRKSEMRSNFAKELEIVYSIGNQKFLARKLTYKITVTGYCTIFMLGKNAYCHSKSRNTKHHSYFKSKITINYDKFDFCTLILYDTVT